MKIKLHKIPAIVTYTYIIFVILSIGVHKTTVSYSKTYIVFAIYLFIMTMFLKFKIKYPISITGIIASTFLIVYLYGFITGFLIGNDLVMIISNFAGMLMYSLFFIFYSIDLDLKIIKKLLVIISIFFLIATIVAYIIVFIFNNGKFRLIPILNSFQEYKSVEYYSKAYIYIVYLYSLYQILFLKIRKIIYFILVISTWVAVFLCIKLQGDELAIVVLTAIFLIAYIRNKMGKFGYMIIAMMALLLGVMYFNQILLFVNYIFDSNDSGNIVRFTQISGLIKVFNFIGYGLGAPLTFGYKGSYGIEVIYLNIFHKFGILSILIFVSYILTFYFSFQILVKSKNNPYDVIPISFLGYLISSLSNPTLFSPPYVLLHVLILLIIKEKFNNNELSLHLFNKRENL